MQKAGTGSGVALLSLVQGSSQKRLDPEPAVEAANSALIGRSRRSAV
jgi:hypothetical protein